MCDHDAELVELERELHRTNLAIVWTNIQIVWYSGGQWLTSAAIAAFIALKVL